jgi:hypothetical protein
MKYGSGLDAGGYIDCGRPVREQTLPKREGRVGLRTKPMGGRLYLITIKKGERKWKEN